VRASAHIRCIWIRATVYELSAARVGWGMHLFFRGEMGHATGWFARAQRLLEREEHECAERGYLLLPVVEQQLDAGACEAAYTTAGLRLRSQVTLTSIWGGTRSNPTLGLI
jgi:hypothetical protein